MLFHSHYQNEDLQMQVIRTLLPKRHFLIEYGKSN